MLNSAKKKHLTKPHLSSDCTTTNPFEVIASTVFNAIKGIEKTQSQFSIGCLRSCLMQKLQKHYIDPKIEREKKNHTLMQ